MLQLSPIIAGCMRWGVWGAQFSEIEYRKMIEACLELDITSFDHADIYGDYSTEAEFGKVLLHFPSLRQKLQLITKTGIVLPTSSINKLGIKYYNCAKEHIIQQVNNSLENFNTDYLDVLLIHRPSWLLNPEEVAEAITELKQSGKILAFGVSNFGKEQIQLLSSWVDIAYNQLELSLFNLQELHSFSLHVSHHFKITPMIWGGLGGGNWTAETIQKNEHILNAVQQVANNHSCTINQILIAWLNRLPFKTLPVIGSTKLHRLQETKEALDIYLPEDEWYFLYQTAIKSDIP